MIIKTTILHSIEPIVKNSRFVRFNKEQIKLLAKKIRDYPVPKWNETYQLKSNLTDTVQYYFFVDSINFCFWNNRGADKWEFYDGKKWLDGYYAFSYAIKKAFLENSRLLNAKYLSEISYTEFRKIFQGKGKLLLLTQRHKIILENFKILHKEFKGSAFEIIKKTGGDANKIVELLLGQFPTFRDEVSYKGKKVYFWKRVQIFVNDVDFALGKNSKLVKNLDDLTIFADYKIPQLLESYGVLNYLLLLKQRIQKYELIEKGSSEEIEIRANTIYACELIRKELIKMGRKINSNELDWLLWVLSKKTNFKNPYHKTLTIFY